MFKNRYFSLCLRILVFFIVAGLFVYVQKSHSSISEKYNELLIRSTRYDDEIESLALQLHLINDHKKKLEEELGKVKVEKDGQINNLLDKINVLNEENHKVKKIFEICSEKGKEMALEKEKRVDGSIINTDFILKMKILEDKVSAFESQNSKNAIELSILHENMTQTNILLAKCGQDMEALTNTISNGKIKKDIKDDRGYVQDNGVHFKRYEPKEANMQFERVNGDPLPLTNILSPKQLINKLEEKKALKDLSKDKNILVELKPNIIEDDLEPNGNEKDYKEME